MNSTMRCAAGLSSLLLVAGCGLAFDPSLPPAKGSVVETPPPTAGPPSPTTSADPRTWEETGRFLHIGGWDRVIGVASGPAGLLAIGDRYEIAGDAGFNVTAHYLWASGDGTSWDEVALPDVLADTQLVAVTTTPTGEFVVYANPPVVVISADGRTGWAEVDSGLGRDLSISNVVRGASGYVLLAGQHAEQDPALWFSADGLGWTLSRQFLQAEHWIQLSDVGAGDDGFVAFGLRIQPEGAEWNRFAVASGDGQSWVETVDPFGDEAPDYRPDAFVAPIGGDWLATVPARDDSARFWWSSDGLSWTERGRIDGLGTSQSWAPVLIGHGGRYYFSPAANDIPAPHRASPTWVSTDGATWQALALADDAVVRAVAVGAGGAVLAGSTLEAAAEAAAAFWLGPPG